MNVDVKRSHDVSPTTHSMTGSGTSDAEDHRPGHRSSYGPEGDSESAQVASTSQTRLPDPYEPAGAGVDDETEETNTSSQDTRELTAPVRAKSARPRYNGKGKEHVKRPRNAFILFSQTKRPQLPTTLSIPEKSKALSEAWRALSDEERAVWNLRSEEEKAEHRLKYPDYKYQPIPRKAVARARQEAKMVKEEAKKEEQKAKQEAKLAMETERTAQRVYELEKFTQTATAAANLNVRKGGAQMSWWPDHGRGGHDAWNRQYVHHQPYHQSVRTVLPPPPPPLPRALLPLRQRSEESQKSLSVEEEPQEAESESEVEVEVDSDPGYESEDS